MNLRKEYDRPFLLEPTKLTRFVDKIHERLADQPQSIMVDHFEAFLAGNRSQDMPKIEDVLALDNSRRQRIKRLVVTCSAATVGAARPDREVQVDFAGPADQQHRNPGSITRVVAITVRGDAGWATRTLSEVEEQVERTWQQSYVRPVAALVILLCFVLLVLAGQFLTLRGAPAPQSQQMWLRAADLDRIEAIVGQQRPITDQELREVTTMQLRNVLEAERPKRPSQTRSTRRLLFVIVPLLVLLGCTVVLLSTCYPRAVFLWGDEHDRYANVLQRRRLAWGVIATIVVGILSKFFYDGVISSIP
jgi:hypothetical protein